MLQEERVGYKKGGCVKRREGRECYKGMGGCVTRGSEGV